MSIVADVLGIPALRAGVDDAAGIGAAVCAAVGAGLFPDWDSAVAAMVTRTSSVLPSPHSEFYQRLRPWHSGVRMRVATLSEWATDRFPQ